MFIQQSFEIELKFYFVSKNIPFKDHCQSIDELDFNLFSINEKLLGNQPLK